MKYTGTVQKGKEYGRTLGFPTANIPYAADFGGIFAATVRVSDATYNAAVYANQKSSVLEAHLLDFEGDLYGKEIAIELAEKLREDQPFSTEDEAKEMIATDVAAARLYFNNH